MSSAKQVVLAAAILLTAGCSGGLVKDQPSYADLVVIYNAELDALDRLERQRSELVANYEKQIRPSAEDAVRALTGVFNSAAGSDRLGTLSEPLTPDRALDAAVESAERTQQVTSQLLDAALQSAQAAGDELSERNAELTDEFERQLAELDQQIEQQKARVERARRDRDAAEGAH